MSRQPVVVRQLDSGDTTALRRWWEVGQAASAARAVDLWTPWEQARHMWSATPADRVVLLLGAFASPEPGLGGQDDVMVGAARLVLPAKDNTHLGFVEVYVHPDHARGGVGRSLIEAVQEVAASRGRSTFVGSVFARPEEDSSSLAFAQAVGYAPAAREEIKVVDLASTEKTWVALEAEAAEGLDGYEIVWWADSTPQSDVEDMLRLLTSFLDEVPLEGVDVHGEQWDESRLRSNEQRRRDAGYRHLTVAARAPDGRLAGFTDVLRAGSTPHHAFIGGTLVMPEHRGHRLGLAMKVRLHQLVREQLPDCRVVMTGNAGVNAHMNAVNARLGYGVREIEVVVQRVLPT